MVSRKQEELLKGEAEESPQKKLKVDTDIQLKSYERRLRGVEERIDGVIETLSYSKGFYDGRKYIVSTAESILCKQTGCKTRDELATSGKIPSFWTSTLILCLNDPPYVMDLTREKDEVKQ